MSRGTLVSHLQQSCCQGMFLGGALLIAAAAFDRVTSPSQVHGAEYHRCTQEQDGQTGCQDCYEHEDNVSYKCKPPHPVNEICQGSLIDNTGCFTDNTACTTNSYIWTQPGCEFGEGQKLDTNEPCGDFIYFQTATNAVGAIEDCGP